MAARWLESDEGHAQLARLCANDAGLVRRGRWIGNGPENTWINLRPTLAADRRGTNAFDRDTKMLSLIVQGEKDLVIKTIQSSMNNSA